MGTLDDLLTIYDKLCVAHAELEERLVGCEPVPHHQHDNTSDLLLADLHRMGVVDASHGGGGYWRISRANSSFVVRNSHSLLDLHNLPQDLCCTHKC